MVDCVRFSASATNGKLLHIGAHHISMMEMLRTDARTMVPVDGVAMLVRKDVSPRLIFSCPARVSTRVYSSSSSTWKNASCVRRHACSRAAGHCNIK